MNKLIFILIIAASSLNANACDICGCGGGNLYIGLLPNFKNKFIGLRYHYMQFHTVIANDKSQFSHNYYNSMELWGGWNIGKKWQVLAFAPYYFNKQVDDDDTNFKNGLGDVTMLGNYQIFHSRRTNAQNKNVEQTFWIGGGVKLPTGSFKMGTSNQAATLADINAQIGTGSTDFLLNALYNLRIGFFGMSTTVNYKIGTANNADYKFGNKFTVNSIIYYRYRVHSVGIAPNVGAIYEHTDANLYNKEKVDYSNSYVVSALAGVELILNKISIGINAQAPIVQSFAAGQTKLQLRGMAHVTFAL